MAISSPSPSPSSPPDDRGSLSPNPKRAPPAPPPPPPPSASSTAKRARSPSPSPSPIFDGRKRRRRQGPTVAVCRDFLRRACARDAVSCKFAHPPPSVSVQEDEVIVCGDSLRRKCFRGDSCRFYHPPPHIQQSLSKEIGVQLEEEKPKPICRDFMRGKCSISERDCRFAHHSLNNNNNNHGGAVCQDFLRGRCERKSCRFSHASARYISPVRNQPYRAPVLPPPSPPRYSYNEETVPVCKDFLKGMCNRASCRYFHPNLQPMSHGQTHYERLERRTYSPPRTAYDQETEKVCNDFLKGMCRRDSCRFLHPNLEPPGSAKTVYGTVYNNTALNRLASPPRTTYREESENAPICRDFMKGLCNRSLCKFSHHKTDTIEHSHHKIEHAIVDYGPILELSRSPPRLSYEREAFVERETGGICRDFMKGLCNRASCKFVHSIPERNFYDEPYREAPLPPRSPPRTAQGEGAGRICRDFLKGLCNRVSCKFLHAFSEPRVSRQSYDRPPMRSPSPPRFSHDEQELMVCKDFLNRMCQRNSCKFAHPSPDAKVVDGKVEICRDFRRGACGRAVCHFYHPKINR